MYGGVYFKLVAWKIKRALYHVEAILLKSYTNNVKHIFQKLAAIGAKETRVLLQALDDQRSELLFLRRSQTKYGCLTPMTFEELEASCFDE